MEFASSYVYEAPDSEYECISDDEFARGMSVSESDSGDERTDAVQNNSHQGPTPRGPAETSSPRKKLKKLTKKSHHWKGQTELQGKLNYVQTDSTSKSNRWFRRADTNIVSVKFNTLLSPGNMHAGDPVVCQSCAAILSHISKPEPDGEDKRWSCEFCAEPNVVDVENEEIPQCEDVTYLLQPAMTTAHSSMSGMDQSLVIFCVDTSGSMCVTSEIEGKVKLRGTDKLKRLQSFNDTRENQWLPSQRRDVTYVSRLQAMQAAVDHQLGEMVKTFPHRRVALITFSSEVCVVGDGSQTEVIVAGDKLNKEEQLKTEGTELALPNSVKESRATLSDKVYKLEEGGSTALGPALVVALSMAGHHPGSKIIVCTDGKANVGLGKMEDERDEETADTFYTDIGEQAVGKGVTISVVTIRGTDCKLVHLGKLADKTGGQVNIVDPLKLQEEFSNVLADPIIATKVKATFILYKDLYVYEEEDPDKQVCRTEQLVGNVTASSVITFQFARKMRQGRGVQETDVPSTSQKEQASPQKVPVASPQKVPVASPQKVPVASPQMVPFASTCRLQEEPMDTQEQTAVSTSVAAPTQRVEVPRSDLPFQLQIEYMDTEGNKALRVITRTMPVTSERHTAEKHINLDVVGVHAAKKSADLALKGEYTSSRSVALMNQRMAWRHSNSTNSDSRGKYKNIFGKLKSMENMLQRQQQSEISRRGTTHSDEEEEEEDMCAEVADCAMPQAAPRSRGFIAKSFASAKKGFAKKRQANIERSKEMNDHMANMVYRYRSVNMDDMSSEGPIGSRRNTTDPLPIAPAPPAKDTGSSAEEAKKTPKAPE